MRRLFRKRAFGATLMALALVAAACGGDSGGDAEVPDGPTITVASFNFPESVILAEIYAQALEDAGYTVERNLNLGARELIFPDVESGDISFLPEYLGSAIAVGFGETPELSVDGAASQLADLFESSGVSVLDPAPGEDKNVFVVTGEFAGENDLSTVADLINAGDVTFAGPPECEQRTTCYAGLVETYALSNVGFEAIAEGAARVAALESGEIDVALLFSTQPVIDEKGFVALEGTDEIIAPESIVPVVNNSIIDAYGSDFEDLINAISAEITTAVLIDLNGRVELEAQNPDDVAGDWLRENDLIG